MAMEFIQESYGCFQMPDFRFVICELYSEKTMADESMYSTEKIQDERMY